MDTKQEMSMAETIGFLMKMDFFASTAVTQEKHVPQIAYQERNLKELTL